jgi:hypothetical protein
LLGHAARLAARVNPDRIGGVYSTSALTLNRLIDN